MLAARAEAEARAASQARAAAASPSEIGRRTLRLQQSMHQERKEAKYMYILHVAGSHAWSRAEPPQLKTLSLKKHFFSFVSPVRTYLTWRATIGRQPRNSPLRGAQGAVHWSVLAALLTGHSQTSTHSQTLQTRR